MALTASQTSRMISLSTPLGTDVLLIERLHAVEAVSQLFRFDLDVLCPKDSAVDFSQLLGQTATVKLELPDASYRYFSGIVRALAQGDYVPGPKGPTSFLRYRMEVVPKFWLLSLTARAASSSR